MKARFHPVTDLDVERYLVGELSGDEAARVEAAARASEVLQRHLDERRAAKRAFALKRPPLRLPAATRPAWWPWALALPVAAAALVAVVRRAPVEGDGPGIARRGAEVAEVEIAVQREEAVFPWRAGVILEPKDRLRLTVKTAAPSVATLIGEDARREPVILYEAVALPGGALTLPGSLEVDDTPGGERLYLFVGPTAPDAPALLKAVRAGRADGALVITLEKRRP
ncbi:MAG: hypothetical protein INH41_02315 [Myxococcaceae bacterium]|jgi:hypothetical protein|nr:hypothetical protein [Myxococcaceae bacterium]MCA3011214.1 hypothetical protein [Myxococcaceae bacterium]